MRGYLNGAGLLLALVGSTVAPLMSSSRHPEAPAARSDEQEAEPLGGEVTDARGERTPSASYRRIVSLHGVADFALLHLVEPERLVGVSGYSLLDHPDGWRFGERPSVGPSNQLEEALALHPDLVIVSNFTSAAQITRLRDAGVAVFDLGPMRGVTTTLANIHTLGRLLRVPGRARALAERYRRELRALDAAVPDEAMASGMYLAVYGDTFFGGTDGTSYADLLHYGGVADLARTHGHRDWPRYRLEDLFIMDPPLIVMQEGMRESLCERPLADRLRACGPDGRIVEIAGASHSDSGLGLVDAAARLLTEVHPDLPAPNVGPEARAR